jgi:hypothetical protein
MPVAAETAGLAVPGRWAAEVNAAKATASGVERMSSNARFDIR